MHRQAVAPSRWGQWQVCGIAGDLWQPTEAHAVPGRAVPAADPGHKPGSPATTRQVLNAVVVLP